MAVRGFNGTSDRITFPGINLNGDYTIAALIKPTDTTIPVNWQSLLSSLNSSARSQLTAYITGTAGLATGADQGIGLLDATTVGNSLGSSTTVKIITASASWKIAVWTKAAGGATPTFSVQILGAGRSDVTGSAGLGNAPTQAGGTLILGAYADPGTGTLSDWLKANVALIGVWTAVLDATGRGALATNSRTSDWTGHATVPTSVWEFAQASTGTSVQDLVGTNHQSSIAGTSVVNGDDPPGWTFSGAAAATSLFPIRRRSRTRGLTIR